MVNKYQSYYKNMEAYTRLNIIRQKSLVAFDPYIGGATLAIFPMNILVSPLLVPIFLMKSDKLSEFALKLQYFLMLGIYLALSFFLLIPLVFLLYLKSVANSVFIMVNFEREDYPKQNVLRFLKALVLGLPVIVLSIFIDILSMPGILMRSNCDFEHKYPLPEKRMDSEQKQNTGLILEGLFEKQKYSSKKKVVSLMYLMTMHTRIFKLIDYLHDLTCVGIKDAEEAFIGLKDYTISKLLSSACSVPTPDGVYKNSECHISIIQDI